MTLPKLDTQSYRSEIQGNPLVLVEFSAVWCPPCRTLQPIMEELSQEQHNAAVYLVDVDEQPEIAAEFGIMSMPTVIAFRQGEPVEKLVGLRPKGTYEAVIRKYTH